jgi:hypothetical protein
MTDPTRDALERLAQHIAQINGAAAQAARAAPTDGNKKYAEAIEKPLLAIELALLRTRDELATSLPNAPGAGAGEAPQALTAAIMQADRESRLEQALRDLMTAYERRVRSSCTLADIDKQPWRCDEFVAAEDVLRQRGKEG